MNNEVRLIDANALKDKIIGDSAIKCGTVFQHIILHIEHAPTIEAEPVRRGEWNQVDECDDTYYSCTACGEEWITIDGTPAENNMNYCPHCGAKMDGGETK